MSARANPNIHASEENLTPLHDAASNGHLEVVRLLLASGADKFARNSQGRTAYDLAAGEDIIAALDSVAVATAPSPLAEAGQSHQLPVSTVDLQNVVVAWPDASGAQWKRVTTALARYGPARASRQVGPTTTHCLVEPDHEEQLPMLLAAQLVGCQLLTAEWLWQSLHADQVLPTEPFQVIAADQTMLSH